MKSIIADRAAKIDASGIRKVFALAASMKDPVNFSIGQPDFDVPEQLKDEAIKAIKRGHNKYTQTAGDAGCTDPRTGRSFTRQYGSQPGRLAAQTNNCLKESVSADC